MTIKESIKEKISKASEKLFSQKELIDFEIEKQDNPEFGDYSTNFALKNSKIIQETPRQIAEKLKAELENDGMFFKIEIAGPGFLNFFLSDEFLINKSKELFLDLKLGIDKKINKKSFLIEFISVNPTGALHLGHLRGGVFGDALANLLNFVGHNAKKEFYVNDAKSSNQIVELGKTALGKGDAYKTKQVMEKIELLKDKLKGINDFSEAGFLVAQELLKDIKEFVENKLQIKFDNWFSEQKDLYDKGKVDELYKLLKEKGIVYEKDDAEWLRLSDFGDERDRVIKRSQSKNFTYILPDIAYHKDKIDRGFDKLIDIFGADHQAHTTSLKAAMKMFKSEDKLEFLIVQMVSLKEGGKKFKFSKREGKVVDAEWFLNEVGLDALRYFYLVKSLDSHMEFDLDLAKEHSTKNPVFYIQYAYARMFSIFQKVGIKDDEVNFSLSEISNKEEKELILELLHFPELLLGVSENYQVHQLAHYLYALAKKIHAFYTESRVIEGESVNQNRLSLALLSAKVLKSGLDILGVSVPEKM